MRHEDRERGVAVFEMLALIALFVVLFSLTLGFFGAIHSAILQSISARHYAFEVLGGRAHYEFHRGWDIKKRVFAVTAGCDSSGMDACMLGSPAMDAEDWHGNFSHRFFYVTPYQEPASAEPFAVTRGLHFFKEIGRPPARFLPRGASSFPSYDKDTGYETSKPGFHQGIVQPTNDDPKPVNPLWIMTGYGIPL